MPKAKSNRAAAKRFKKTGTGKIKRGKSGAGHMLTSKTKKRKRSLRKSGTVAGSDMKKMQKLLPG